MIKLETERFNLVELTPEQVSEQYLNWLNSQSADFIIHKTQKLIELKQYVQQCWQNPNCWLFGIFTKNDHEHIGNIKFETLAADSLIEMGILIGESAWQGKGVAGEVIYAAAEYFYQQHGKTQMVLGVDKKNQPAICAYKKLGFVEELEPLSYVDVDTGLLMSWHLKQVFSASKE